MSVVLPDDEAGTEKPHTSASLGATEPQQQQHHHRQPDAAVTLDTRKWRRRPWKSWKKWTDDSETSWWFASTGSVAGPASLYLARQERVESEEDT